MLLEMLPCYPTVTRCDIYPSGSRGSRHTAINIIIVFAMLHTLLHYIQFLHCSAVSDIRASTLAHKRSKSFSSSSTWSLRQYRLMPYPWCRVIYFFVLILFVIRFLSFHIWLCFSQFSFIVFELTRMWIKETFFEFSVQKMQWLVEKNSI